MKWQAAPRVAPHTRPNVAAERGPCHEHGPGWRVGVVLRLLCALLLVLAGTGGCALADSQATAIRVTRIGEVTVRGLQEISGMSVSRRRPDRLWVINDSGNPPELVALDLGGAVRARYRVEGVRNHDWEDLAAVEMEGVPYLLIGDIGDNLARRADLQLLLLREPDPDAGTTTAPIVPRAVLRFRFPDGPRDAEGLAVDSVRREILVSSKREAVPSLYRLPLDFDVPPGTVVLAERLGPLLGLRGSGLPTLAAGPLRALFGSSPTAIELSADGRVLYVLTYAAVHRLVRGPGEAWGTALEREAEPVALHPLQQAEALAGDPRDGRLYLTSEGRPAPLLEIIPPAW